MKRRKLAGTPAPVIGEGTWQMEDDDRSEAVGAIRHAIDLGVTHIDTAEMYGNGAVERIVGEAISGHRDDVFLASKILPTNASRAGTIRACERSLKRLGTDRLDLYMLHWPGDHPLEETVEAFETLRADGKIRAWGVSNFDADELQEVVEIAGPDACACNQVLYHLGERSIEREVIPRCESLGVTVVAYSPLGSGEFVSPRSQAGRELAAVAKRAGATPRQVALAFLVRHPSVIAIPKTASTAHVEENARAGDLALPAEAIKDIDALFPLGPPRAGVPIL